MPGIIDLLRLYVRDRSAAEAAYQQDYRALISKEDWERCKRSYGTAPALRKYTTELYAYSVNRFAEARGERRLREHALAEALVAAKRLVSEDDLDAWLQGELKHAALSRLDAVMLFVGHRTVPAPLLDLAWRDAEQEPPPGASRDPSLAPNAIGRRRPRDEHTDVTAPENRAHIDRSDSHPAMTSRTPVTGESAGGLSLLPRWISWAVIGLACLVVGFVGGLLTARCWR